MVFEFAKTSGTPLVYQHTAPTLPSAPAASLQYASGKTVEPESRVDSEVLGLAVGSVYRTMFCLTLSASQKLLKAYIDVPNY